jgi:hypothetical protein
MLCLFWSYKWCIRVYSVKLKDLTTATRVEVKERNSNEKTLTSLSKGCISPQRAKE